MVHGLRWRRGEAWYMVKVEERRGMVHGLRWRRGWECMVHELRCIVYCGYHYNTCTCVHVVTQSILLSDSTGQHVLIIVLFC